VIGRGGNRSGVAFSAAYTARSIARTRSMIRPLRGRCTIQYLDVINAEPPHKALQETELLALKESLLTGVSR